ncbi:unnamed protein product [Ilex paraguariensis]|uniref:Uncharacterized protein n=1 Tax=Ilex paraguariensis TaxID=185542 RepID=A0ABC8TVG2_9AQUA
MPHWCFYEEVAIASYDLLGEEFTLRMKRGGSEIAIGRTAEIAITKEPKFTQLGLAQLTITQHKIVEIEHGGQNIGLDTNTSSTMGTGSNTGASTTPGNTSGVGEKLSVGKSINASVTVGGTTYLAVELEDRAELPSTSLALFTEDLRPRARLLTEQEG